MSGFSFRCTVYRYLPYILMLVKINENACEVRNGTNSPPSRLALTQVHKYLRVQVPSVDKADKNSSPIPKSWFLHHD